MSNGGCSTVFFLSLRVFPFTFRFHLHFIFVFYAVKLATVLMG